MGAAPCGRTDQQRATVARYYARNASRIITYKTMTLARERGRVPRETTIQTHSMDRDALKHLLQSFQAEHPDSRAAKKIARFLHDHEDLKE
jgi:hypothetical protein